MKLPSLPLGKAAWFEWVPRGLATSMLGCPHPGGSLWLWEWRLIATVGWRHLTDTAQGWGVPRVGS